MSYQNSVYQNVATDEDENLNHPEPSTQQQSYHSGPIPSSSNVYLPTYHQYMYNQQGSFGDFPGMGFYGPNVGAIGDYTRRVRKNRRMIGFIVAAFILIVLLPHHNRDSNRGNHSTNTVDSSGRFGPDHVDVDAHHSGIAGDGDHWTPNSSSAINTSPPQYPSGPANVAVGGGGGGSASNSSGVSNGQQHLKIAYLLAFPRSGTSYTMRLVGETMSTSLAVNYETLAKLQNSNNEPVPVFQTMDSSGQSFAEYASPFYLFMNSNSQTPHNYILTLTHCGGVCMYPCGPMQYIKTQSSFEEDCRLVIKDGPPITVENIQQNLTPWYAIGKLVHLIRDPFSNIVSRFLAYREIENNNYTNDTDGFQKYCSDMDSDVEMSQIEASTTMISDEIKFLLRNLNVPCHSEFFRYIDWHNHAVEIAWNHEYPTMTLYYEDFNTPQSRSQQAVDIANFLETQSVDVNKVPQGLIINNYRNYFSQPQQAAIESLTRTMALTKTMTLLERYFPPQH